MRWSYPRRLWVPDGRWMTTFVVRCWTHWIDCQLRPGSAALKHTHSILWFAMLLLIVAVVGRLAIPVVWVVGLAVFLCVIDDGHGNAKDRIANRNVLVAPVFGLASLLARDRQRRDGWRVGSLLWPLSSGYPKPHRESSEYRIDNPTSYSRPNSNQKVLSIVTPVPPLTNLVHRYFACAGSIFANSSRAQCSFSRTPEDLRLPPTRSGDWNQSCDCSSFAQFCTITISPTSWLTSGEFIRNVWPSELTQYRCV
jgi:hypothetical protein